MAGEKNLLNYEKLTLYDSMIKSYVDGQIHNSEYVLPPATTESLGGIKIGNGLSIDENGVTNVELPTASTSTKGGVKVDGTTITVNNEIISATSEIDDTSSSANKTWSASKISQEILNSSGGTTYTVGTGLVETSGTLKAKLKSDTASSLAATSMGSTADRQYAVGVDTDGYLSVNVPWTDTAAYTLPPASSTSLGGVRIDNETIFIDNDNKIRTTVNPSTYLYTSSEVGSTNIIPASFWENESSNPYLPTFTINPSTGYITINGDLHAGYSNNKWTYYSKYSLTSTLNTASNYNVLENKVYFLKGCPINQNISIEILDERKNVVIATDTGKGAIVDLRQAYLDYDPYGHADGHYRNAAYQININIFNSTNSNLSFDCSFKPELVELTNYNSIMKIGNGLTLTDGVLSSNVNVNINPLTHTTITSTVDGQSVTEDRLAIQNFQYNLYEKTYATPSNKSKMLYFDSELLGITANTNYLYIDYSAEKDTSGSGTVIVVEGGEEPAHDTEWGLRARLYQITSSEEATLIETMYLNVDGENYGDGTGGLQNGLNHFASYLSPNTKYKIYLTILGKTHLSGGTGSNLINVNVKIYINNISSYISPTHFQGNFVGSFKGNSELNSLVLPARNTDLVYDTVKGTFSIDDEDSSYYGARFGLSSTKHISYTTDQNDITSIDYISMTASDITQYHDSNINDSTNGTTKTVEWSTSDERAKENISDLNKELSINLINITSPKQFNYLGESGKHYGMIAQQVRENLNALGETNSALEYSIGDTETLQDQRNIHYAEYIPHLINYVKDLQSQINVLQQEIKSLKEENNG